MSVHVVHTSVMHDSESCEVCIHVQSNDDWSDERADHYLVFDAALHDRFSGDNHSSVHAFQHNSDLIRGPPCFT